MKKFLLALVLFICTSSIIVFASDISDAKRSLKSAQKELSSVISKRDKALYKQNQLQEDLEEALAKKAAKQDKPKSLAYKDAVKKSEALPVKLEQNAQLLASLNRQVDSLQNIVSKCESALAQVENEESKEKKEEEVSAIEPAPEPIIEPTIEQPVEKVDKRETIKSPNESEYNDSTSSDDKDSSSSKPTTFLGKVWRVIKIIFWIFIGIIVLRILMKIGGKSGGSSVSGGDKDAKRRQIASIQAEIAKLQADIANAKSWERQRGAKQTKIDIDNLKHSIALKQAEIARIKARR